MKNKIICPHCSEEHDGFDYIEPGDMEGSFEMDCTGCEEKFTVTYETSINFVVNQSASPGETERMPKECRCGCRYTIEVRHNDGKNHCHFCSGWY